MVNVVLRRVGDGVGGSIGLRKAKHLVELDAHLQANLYLSAKAVTYWVKETFGVSYTQSGVTVVLRRLGYVYKKHRLVPGKADREAQTQFLETYDHIRNLQGQDDPIYFMDATHPQHHPVLAGGWIKRGEEQGIPTNTGRRHLNINGAIDLERLEPVVRCHDTINANSTIAFVRAAHSVLPHGRVHLCYLRQHTLTTVPKQFKTT